MSLEQPVSVGDSYASFIKDKWQEAIELGQIYEYNKISRVRDNDNLNQYIAVLIILYKALDPKVNGRIELKSYKTDFIAFKPFINNSEKLSPTITQSREGGDMVEITNDDKIRELETIIRNILEELNITRF